MEEKRVADTPTEHQLHPHTSNNYHETEVEDKKRQWWAPIMEPGHAVQVVIAAVLAIALGMGITAAVGASNIPPAVPAVLNIPGDLWLRALQCVVIPMIVCAMILSVQSLRQISNGGKKLARWTVSWYVGTTVLAVGFSMLMMTQIWEKLMGQVEAPDNVPTDDEVREEYADREELQPHDIAVELARTIVPSNLVDSFAKTQLLGIMIAAIVLGYYVDPHEDSSILRAVKELNGIIARILSVLIKLAPVGVFFLIFSNIFRLDVAEIGESLGYLIGAGMSSMMIHCFIVLPALFFGFTRRNPYPYWFKCIKAIVTVWGTASSAATLPVTLRVTRERGNPGTVVDFCVPLGTVINMDGTAIYMVTAVIFLAKTQGIDLDAGQYIQILLLSTLAAIGTTPIPSASLVLMVMVSTSAGIPLSGMYAVVVAIDWFMDRFRGVVNVTGDLYAVAIIAKMTGIKDPLPEHEAGEPATYSANDERV